MTPKRRRLSSHPPEKTTTGIDLAMRHAAARIDMAFEVSHSKRTSKLNREERRS
jgi:hypothetical protein